MMSPKPHRAVTEREAPLSPALKAYLAAFDRHLLGETPVARAVARVEMTDRLAAIGIQARDRLMYGDGPRRARGKEKECVDCATPICAAAERCRKCAADERWASGAYRKVAA